MSSVVSGSGRTLIRSIVLSALVIGESVGATVPATQSRRSATAREVPSAIRVGVLRPGGGYAIETVPLEAYVARVLTGEALPDSQPAALEALAITIRTYGLANRGRHGADGFDLCDQTHCQVMRSATPATERAATATAGRVLWDGDSAASVYYSASCGGRSEVPSAVWPGMADPSFLPSRPDDACGGGPIWAAEIADGDLVRALRAAGYRGERLRQLRIASRNASGRVSLLRLEGLTPTQISGQDLRVVVGRTLGWQHIKSTAFDLKRVTDGYRFNGHGSGHGVGLCVIGSARLAVDGRSADQILRRYFPGLTIAAGRTAPSPRADSGTSAGPSIAPSREAPESAPAAGPVSSTTTPAPTTSPDVLIALPDGDEGERGFVASVVARSRDDLARALQMAAPRVTLRFHPTISSYEQATLEPWFTSGAFVNGEIHLLPPAMLRERGVLESAIRHQLVHAMAAPPLAGRPLWVLEGAAQYFAGADPGSGIRDPGAGMTTPTMRKPVLQPRTECPADSELSQPVSIGALMNAYARARLCFARQVAQGKSWRDVR
jgi:SpoIID/LytB domain protein